MSTTVPAIAAPAVLDEIEIFERTGLRGGLARHRARDRSTGALLALDQCASGDALGRARLARATRALVRVRHPGVVALVRAGVGGGVAYLAVAAPPSAQLAQPRRPRTWPQVLAIALGASRGLAALHGRGVAHGGLEPGRLRLGPGDEVVLDDLGDAVLMDAAPPGLGAPAAQPRYLAPEVRRGEPPTPRSDLWSLGLMLYELVAEPRPIDLDGRVAALSTLRPGLPRAIAELIGRCLEPRPADRPDAAGLVRDTLERAMVHAPPAITTALPVLPADDQQRVAASFSRVAGRAAPFADGLLERLVAGAPELAPFAGAPGAARRVFGALHIAIALLGAHARLESFLIDLGHRAVAGLPVAAPVAGFQRSLEATLAQHDPAWDPPTAAAWRSALATAAVWFDRGRALRGP